MEKVALAGATFFVHIKDVVILFLLSDAAKNIDLSENADGGLKAMCYNDCVDER